MVCPTGTTSPTFAVTPPRMPVGLRLDFDDGLVGLDLEEHLALGDLLALFLLPGHQLAGLLGHLEGGHDDAYGHRCVGVEKRALKGISAMVTSSADGHVPDLDGTSRLLHYALCHRH